MAATGTSPAAPAAVARATARRIILSDKLLSVIILLYCHPMLFAKTVWLAYNRHYEKPSQEICAL